MTKFPFCTGSDPRRIAWWATQLMRHVISAEHARSRGRHGLLRRWWCTERQAIGPQVGEASELDALARAAPIRRGGASRPKYRDEPADRGPGWQPAGCGEGVQAVAPQLLGHDIVADISALGALGQQIAYEVAEVLLRSGDVLTPMHERRDLSAVMLMLNERARLESLAGVAGLVAELGELFEVPGAPTFVPRDQDRFDVRGVLVQRRASHAGLLGDLRHVTARSLCLATSAAVVSRVAPRARHRDSATLNRLVAAPEGTSEGQSVWPGVMSPVS